jgi:hypothetical protein
MNTESCTPENQQVSPASNLFTINTDCAKTKDGSAMMSDLVQGIENVRGGVAIAIEDVYEATAGSMSLIRAVQVLSGARDLLDQMIELSTFIELKFDQVAITPTSSPETSHNQNG